MSGSPSGPMSFTRKGESITGTISTTGSRPSGASSPSSVPRRRSRPLRSRRRSAPGAAEKKREKKRRPLHSRPVGASPARFAGSSGGVAASRRQKHRPQSDHDDQQGDQPPRSRDRRQQGVDQQPDQ